MKFYLALAFVFHFSLLLATDASAGVKIKFPEEELSTESTLPVFEEKVAILNRKVKHAERFELNLMGGIVASEPLYNPVNFGGSITYHFDNTHAVHLMGTLFAGGLNSNGIALQTGQVILADGSVGALAFDASLAPSKEMFIAAHYQYTAYYGKISLTNDFVMNLTLSGLFGGGAYIMGDLIAPAANIGLSQRFYFNSSVAIRFDILLTAFSGPDITSAGQLNPGAQPPASSQFETSLQFDSTLLFGLSFLL